MKEIKINMGTEIKNNISVKCVIVNEISKQITIISRVDLLQSCLVSRVHEIENWGCVVTSLPFIPS